MNDYVLNCEINELKNGQLKILNQLLELLAKVKSDEDLWDNSDMIRNWKVSERTLANWRYKNLIGFVQVNSKIWYPREARDEFLIENYIK